MQCRSSFHKDITRIEQDSRSLREHMAHDRAAYDELHEQFSAAVVGFLNSCEKGHAGDLSELQRNQIEEVMADFRAVEQQHRNINVVSLAQFGIGINIQFKPVEIQFIFVHVQGVTHVIAQMTAFSDDQSESLHGPWDIR